MIVGFRGVSGGACVRPLWDRCPRRSGVLPLASAAPCYPECSVVIIFGFSLGLPCSLEYSSSRRRRRTPGTRLLQVSADEAAFSVIYLLTVLNFPLHNSRFIVARKVATGCSALSRFIVGCGKSIRTIFNKITPLQAPICRSYRC